MNILDSIPRFARIVHLVTAGEIGESFTTWNEASSLLVNDVREEFPVTNAFVEMVENVSRVIEGDSGWVVPSTDSIRVAQILDSIANRP